MSPKNPSSTTNPSRGNLVELEQARAAIEERLRLETLVSEVSAGFLNLPADRVDAEIERRLGHVGEFLRFERAGLMEFHEGDPHLRVTHTWSAQSIPPPADRILLDRVPWSFARVRRGDVLHFSRVEDLPAEASQDREFYRSAGHRSVVAIPLDIADAELGLVGFVSLTDEREWAADLLPRLRLIGEIFASALVRKRADEALRVSEQRYRTLVENAPEAVVVLDADLGHLVDVNDNAVRLFKLDREKLLQCSLAQLSPPTQPDGRTSEERAGKAIARALDGEKPVFEWIHRDAEGRDIPTEVRLVRQPSARGNLVRGSLTDITERKRLEQELHQSQKMEAVGRLAGGVAHDFNNLLMAIQGNAELALAKGGADNPCEAELQEIFAASERAAALTRQLLAFSRKQNVQPRVLSVNQLVHNLSNMLGRVIGEDVRLLTVLEASRHHVEADPGQLEQVIVNLAVNARDAMPKGGTLTIATKDLLLEASRLEGNQQLAPGHYVVLEVSDTGAGIPIDLQPRIFEPFFTTKERGKGTGLGLSTAYGVIAQNRGSIRVQSARGRGSTFEIWLPCTHRRPENQDGQNKGVICGTETVLLVEDEEIVRDLVLRGLKKYGYTVLEAASGEEALQISEEHEGSIEMLVTDVIMPGMSGADLAEQICAQRRDIEVLFVSGYADDLVESYGVSGDRGALLGKPFSPDALARKVREQLDRWV